MLTGVARAAVALLLATAIARPQDAAAQDAPRLQVEQRVDVFTADPVAVHVGAGLTTPLGTYVRLGAVGGIGKAAGENSSRLDLVARFTLDPFREKRWAPYGVAGVSSRFGRAPGNYLVLLAGVEGPPLHRGFAPAVELGLGGGFRLGVALRQAFPRRR